MSILIIFLQLRDYSLREFKKKIHSGNVFVGPANEGFLHQLQNDSSMRTNKNNKKHYLFTQALGVGFLCQAILVWVVIVTAIKRKVKEYLNNSKTYSFQFYGILCGLTVVAFLLCTAAVLACIRIITTMLKWPKDYAEYTLYVITTGVWVLPGMPILQHTLQTRTNHHLFPTLS